MMTPLRCEGRGGDQKRLIAREVIDDMKFRGGPLGSKI